jgi:hypothetical protein
VASIGMGGGVLLLAHLLRPWLSGHGMFRYIAFAAVIAAGLALYALLAQITGAARLAELRQQLRRGGADAPAAEAG